VTKGSVFSRMFQKKVPLSFLLQKRLWHACHIQPFYFTTPRLTLSSRSLYKNLIIRSITQRKHKEIIPVYSESHTKLVSTSAESLTAKGGGTYS
jgi:hypothetical protein